MIGYRNTALGGVCDRTFGFTFALAVAKMRNECLVTNWKTSEACPFEFDEVFDYPEEVVVVNGDLSGERIMSFNGCWGLLMCDRHQKMYYEYKDLIGSSYETFCEVHKNCIRELKFKSNVGHCEDAEGSVGIHFRHTDVLYLRNKTEDMVASFYEGFIDSLSRLPEHSFYVCGDNKKSTELVITSLKNLGKTVFYNQGAVYDSSKFRQTPASDLIFDIISLSKCKMIYGNVMSGVTALSSIMANSYKLEYYHTTMADNHETFYNNWKKGRI